MVILKKTTLVASGIGLVTASVLSYYYVYPYVN